MSRVILGMTMSLDGFVNDKDGGVGRLYPDLADLRFTDMLQESIRDTGAVVMGKHGYEMGQGDFTGYEYQVPIFVVAHDIPATVAKGENDKLKFNFVTDGIESAINKAKAAAGDKDVTVVGGASTAQQCLNAGLVDILEVGIVPVLFGEGLRFFEHLDTNAIKLERIKLYELPQRTDIWFRVVK